MELEPVFGPNYEWMKHIVLKEKKVYWSFEFKIPENVSTVFMLNLSRYVERKNILNLAE
jgi:hypothetical protein